MRKMLLMSAALFGAAVAAPAFAQTSPSPSTGSAGATPPATYGGTANPGSARSGSGTQGTAPSTGAPSTGSAQYGGSGGTAGSPAGTADTTGSTGMGTRSQMDMHGTRSGSGTRGAMTEDGARPGHTPGIGQSEPMSRRASNINNSGRGEVAPRLPTPSVGEDASADAYLRAAQRALRERRTGAAQEALERASTRLLNRAVLTSGPGASDQVPGGQALQTVNQALTALGQRDMATAQRLVDEALQQTASMGNEPNYRMGQGGMGQRGMGEDGTSQGGMSQGGMSQGGMPRSTYHGSGHPAAGAAGAGGTGPYGAGGRSAMPGDPSVGTSGAGQGQVGGAPGTGIGGNSGSASGSGSSTGGSGGTGSGTSR